MYLVIEQFWRKTVVVGDEVPARWLQGNEQRVEHRPVEHNLI